MIRTYHQGLFFVAALLSSAGACPLETVKTAPSYRDAGDARAVWDAAEPTWLCDAGFVSTPDGSCAVEREACSEVGCSGHGRCVVSDAAASCDCDLGYYAHDLSCIENPNAAAPLVWFVHVTDLHFGDSADISDSLAVVLNQVLPVVEPAVTIASGDITDIGSSAEWSGYRSVIDAVALSYPSYLEVPGNHDVKRDHAPNFLAQSQTGRAGGGLYGQDFIGTSVGRVRVIRTHTADSSSNLVNIAGTFGAEQADALMVLQDEAPSSLFPIVVGHHPMTGVERLRSGFDRMQALIQQSGARLYFCGHTHSRDLSWLGSTLIVQGDSLGKSDPGSFALVALDETGPAAIFVPVTSGLSWPQVLITTPADPDLGGVNPFAQPLAAGASLKLRAIAFSPQGIDALRFQLGAVDAAATEVRAHVWEASVTVPAGSGTLTLTATATDSAAASADRSIQLAYP